MPNWAIFDDAVMAAGYTTIPNLAWRLPCSPTDKACYFALLGYAWQEDSAWPSVPALAGVLGCTENTVRESLRKLQQIGAIRLETRGEGLTRLVRFRRISEVLSPGTPSESAPLQNLNPFRNCRGTPSEIAGGPLQNLHPTMTGRREDTPPPPAGDAPAGDGPPPPDPPEGGNGRAKQRRRRRRSDMTEEQVATWEAGKAALYETARRRMNMAIPPGYEPRKTYRFFKERVLAGDTADDFRECVAEYFLRLDAGKYEAAIRGRHITPAGSAEHFMSSYGSLLLAVVERREAAAGLETRPTQERSTSGASTPATAQ